MNPKPILMKALHRSRARWRRARMRAMVDRLRLPTGSKVLDLGGTDSLWRLFAHDFHVTLVNLPSCNPPFFDSRRFVSVEADCCDLRSIFPDACFDLAFSNATIEHVGDAQRQSKFANEVRRLGRAYWVETPSSACPIECHTGIPFYWHLPRKLRNAILNSWSHRYPAWVDWLRETRVLSRSRMRELFPDA
jgi:hypothetical protein